MSQASLIRAKQTFGVLRRSLLDIWLLLGPPVATVILCFASISGSLKWEYLRNPTRHLYEVVVMVPVMTILSSIIWSLSQALVFFVLPFYAFVLLCYCGRIPLIPLLLATPLLGLLVWFGYEHFVPEYHFFLDDSPPYQYGLTLSRFLIAWLLEGAIVLVYWWPFRTTYIRSNQASPVET